MQDPPTRSVILAAAVEHLAESLLPTLSGRQRFGLRVVIRALQLCIRDEALRTDSEAAEGARLNQLLDQAGSVETLNRLLSDQIRSGAKGSDTSGLLAHLEATARAKMAIDQPDYGSYRNSMGEGTAIARKAGS